MKKVSFIIAENSFLIRKGLLSIINSLNDLSIIQEIDNKQELLNYKNKFNPDFIIVNPDLLLKGDYLDLTELFSCYKKTKFVALVIDHIDEKIKNQFDDVIHINDPKDKIIKKFNKLQKPKYRTGTNNNESSDLSQREKEILKYLTLGYTSKDIADKLFISIHTVNTHRKNITNKLEIKTVSGLTVYAILNHLINMEDIQ